MVSSREADLKIARQQNIEPRGPHQQRIKIAREQYQARLLRAPTPRESTKSVLKCGFWIVADWQMYMAGPIKARRECVRRRTRRPDGDDIVR